MMRHDLPTARHATFTKAAEAYAYVEQHGAPIVIKADGLAAGKGVVVAAMPQRRKRQSTIKLVHNKFGDAGARVVIEEFLEGEEASFIVMADGAHVLPSRPARIISGCWTATSGPTPAAWGPIRPRRW